MTRETPALARFGLVLLFAFAGGAAAADDASIEVSPPPVALAGLEASVGISLGDDLGEGEVAVEIRDRDGAVVARGAGGAGETLTLAIPHARAGADYAVLLPGRAVSATPVVLRVIPGWLALMPPLLAIVLALLFRQVVPALVAGIWVGALIVTGGPLEAFLRTVDKYTVVPLTDKGKISIVVFSMLLGGMVGVMAKSGGTLGLVAAMRPYATSTRRGQLVTWLMGILIFFDDYANTLLVGNTMRPVTDRLRISREKLAYIVDSTAAPVAAIGLISTWIGYEVGLIRGALHAVGSDASAYAVFLRSIPYNFYPILALVFGVLVAASQRDFGPMLRAERRARDGKVLGGTAVPLSDFDSSTLLPVEGRPQRWFNAVIPVVVVLAVTFAGLWVTGRQSLAAAGDPAATTGLFGLGLEGLGTVFGAGDSLSALLWASLSGCLAAMVLAGTQRILGLGELLDAWVQGVRSLVVAVIILVLAWAIAAVCQDLNTSGYMVNALSDVLDPRLLPLLVFVLAGLTAFATGTSWGTMGILLPLAVPIGYGVAQQSALDPGATDRILLGTVSAVLAGAIFGDHCSPISDTTVMSSMASACDHVDHVRTQLPYALVVAVVAIVTGYVPAAFGMPPLVCLVVGGGILAGTLYAVGRRA